MRRRCAVLVGILGVIVALPYGCGRGPEPAASMAPQVEDAAAIVKGVQGKAVSSGGAAAGGADEVRSTSVVEVGSHRLKVSMDVPTSYTLQGGETAAISFHGRKLAVEFARGRVLLDDAERAKLPAGTKEVDVQLASGKLSVAADGTSVLTTDVPK